MLSNLYHLFVYDPLYNWLIFLFNIFPWIDAGFIVIIFTIIIRLILFPLSKKSVITQVRMKEIEPELNKIKNNVKDKQEQALKIMELYKNKGVNPFSSFFLILIQLPIMLSFYWIFKDGLPVVDTSLLYSFIKVPTIDMHFLGIFDIGVKSLFLSLCAGLSQFLQLHFSLATNTPPADNSNPAMNATHNMMKNMKYVFPVMITIFSYGLPAVLAIYWTISNLFTLGQEIVVRKHIKNHEPI